MDVYELSVDLASGVRDTQFVAALDAYLGALQRDDKIESWRLLRRKLGFGIGTEFKVLIETRDLAQLDAAFSSVARRSEPLESVHHGVNSLVTNFRLRCTGTSRIPNARSARNASDRASPTQAGNVRSRRTRDTCVEKSEISSVEPVDPAKPVRGSDVRQVVGHRTKEKHHEPVPVVRVARR